MTDDAERAGWDVGWSLDPPWPFAEYRHGETNECERCSREMPPYWRHYWPPCRLCRIWSFAGTRLMIAFGLDPRGQMYRGARSWCGDCQGTGWLPCVPQDLSIMRRSGSCAVCGEWSFMLFHATAAEHGDIEGSARHYDGVADHEVIVGSAPLVRSLTETFARAEADG